MNKRTFIKVAGFSTLGLALGIDLFGNNDQNKFEIIEIDLPQVHVRHGMYNFDFRDKTKEGIIVQRDVFNENGLEDISNSRICSIKFKKGNEEAFGVLSSNGFESTSANLSAMKLNKNQLVSISLVQNEMLLSEFDCLKVDGVSLKNNQAFASKKGGVVNIVSEVDQYIYTYRCT